MPNNSKIRFCYRKIIDASSNKAWEKFVFEDTYKEFLMQSQFYNLDHRFNYFSEIINTKPEADKLHGLVSTAALGYLKQLNGKIPDILDTLGRKCLEFNQFQFEIIESHVKEKKLHCVAINFHSDPYLLIHDFGNNLLISPMENHEAYKNNETIPTNLLALQPFLSISLFQSL